MACPCGSNLAYARCCGLYISGEHNAPTPEALMRSRYTAYTRANINYIVRTMKAPANVDFDPESARKWAKRSRWLKLEVLNTSTQGDLGSVEFRAHYSLANQKHVIHEISEFRKDDGNWYYISGVILENNSLS